MLTVTLLTENYSRSFIQQSLWQIVLIYFAAELSAGCWERGGLSSFPG